MVSDKISKLLIGFVVSLALVKYFSQPEFGMWSYALAFLTIANTLAVFSGVDALAIKKFAQQEKAERGCVILGTIVGIRLACATLSFGATATVSYFLNDPATHRIIVILMLAFLFQPFHSVDYLFQGKLQPKYSAVVLNLSAWLFAGAKITLIQTRWLTLELLAALNICEAIFIAAGYLMLLHRYYPGYSIRFWKINKKYAVYFIKYSGFMMLNSLLGIMVSRVTILQLKAMTSLNEVAIFSFSLTLFESMLMVVYMLSNAYFPKLMRIRDELVYRSELRKVTAYGLLFWTLMAGALWPMLSLFDPLIKVLIPASYRLSLFLLLEFAPVGYIVIVNFYLLQYFYVAENKTLRLLFRTLMGFFVLITANHFLIKSLRLHGAVAALFLAQGGILFLSIMAEHKIRSLLFAIKRIHSWLPFGNAAR